MRGLEQGLVGGGGWLNVYFSFSCLYMNDR